MPSELIQNTRKRGRAPRTKAPKLRELAGRRHVTGLLKLRRKLRRAHAHPNRVRHYDDVLTVLLPAFFNPVIRSLRMIEDFSTAPGTQDELDIERICKSTLSEANRILDPRLLEPLIADLQAKIPHLQQTDALLGRLLKHMRLVDGSFFSLAAHVQWALRKGKAWARDHDDRFARLDLQLCAHSGTPACLEINGRGSSEVAAARRHIEKGVLYVADRGIFSFKYIEDLLMHEADFVLRIFLPDGLFPSYTSTKTSDAVKLELASLNQGLANPDSIVYGVDLSQLQTASGQNAHDRRLELIGQVKVNGLTLHDALEKRIKQKDYRTLIQAGEPLLGERKVEIERILSRYRQVALQAFVKENPAIGKAIHDQKQQEVTQQVLSLSEAIKAIKHR